MENWDGRERRIPEEFGRYKELILNEIKEIKEEFKAFRDSTDSKVNAMQITLAVLNQKIITMSAIASTLVGAVVAYVMDKVLK